MVEARDIHLEHLNAELARIDVIVRQHVRATVQAGQDANDPLRGLHLSDAQALGIAARTPISSWAAQAKPSSKLDAEDRSEREGGEACIRTVVDLAKKNATPTRLMVLASAFGLSRFELDALMIALAPQLDTRYEQLYGFLNDDMTRKSATVNLVLDLLCEPGIERLSHLVQFADGSPLFLHGLLRDESDPVTNRGESSLLTKHLSTDPAVVLWLLGNYVPGSGTRQPDAYSSWHLLNHSNQISETVEPWLTKTAEIVARDGPTVMSFHGADSAAQLVNVDTFLRISRRSGLYANLSLVLPHQLAEQAGADGKDTDSAMPMRGVEPMQALQHLRRALRDARMVGAVAVLDGWEACLNEGMLPPSLFQELVAQPDSVIMLSRSRWNARGGLRSRRVIRHDFGMPGFERRQEFWIAATEAFDPGEEVVHMLSGQFALTSAQIEDSVQAALDLAAQRGDARPVSTDLFAAARMHVSPRLSLLARKITPRHGWKDIILPDDQIETLRELVSMVRNRPMVLETWEVGNKLMPSAGVTTMFAGPPGTGKTMSAEVIAAHLELDLYKIDLSSMVSKYIGETEKNLEKVFREAERSNAILFFDEADAIFGKRGDVRDANDRYANIEVSYLLQRMEAYDGVTILATNLRSNLDEAFIRRLQFVVDFPFPDEKFRLKLWHSLFPVTVPHDPDLDFEALAKKFKLSGGNIRNVIVGACYLAADNGAGGRVSNDHLHHALRRELQKMGRLFQVIER